MDLAIALAVDGFFIDGEDHRGRPKYCYRDETGQVSPGQGHDMLVRHYTASIDAALALVERVLPGCEWSVGRDEGGPVAIVWGSDCTISMCAPPPPP